MILININGYCDLLTTFIIKKTLLYFHQILENIFLNLSYQKIYPLILQKSNNCFMIVDKYCTVAYLDMFLMDVDKNKLYVYLSYPTFFKLHATF